MENADRCTARCRRSRDDVAGTQQDAATDHGGTAQKRSDRLVTSEKLAAIGDVSASIAHSLKNPLAAIRAMAQAEIESRQLTGENLRDIMKMTDRLTGAHESDLGFL